MQTDVIIIGGGHAGVEAAAASARYGAKTVLVTHALKEIGAMSCNPAIGGLGKGHLVREIDALDGLMAKAIDRAGIHFRILNMSRGPAVQGPRAQADRQLYKQAVQDLLAQQANLTIIEGAAHDIIQNNGQLAGLTLEDGRTIHAKAVVITTGTFLRGLIHLGAEQWPAGRMGEQPAIGLAETIEKLGLPLGRLKTGTPPRLDGRTIAWHQLEAQPGDTPPTPFSTMTEAVTTPQIHCHITYTSPASHALLQANIKQSPMYSGQIQSSGPRYCPSIEDKVVRFADKERHQIFLEPEGLNDHTVYPNGISTSLPKDIQDQLVASIPGLENAKILQYGYAIEYDYVDPRALTHGLQTRQLPGLFLAGQINGTTGYEEAGAQGLLAGLNAARLADGQPEINFTRADGYIGVMVDDLVTKGVLEPYRMFTSRAEYRLSLRTDNADLRLTPLGIEASVVTPARQAAFEAKQQQITALQTALANQTFTPPQLAAHGIQVKQDGQKRNVLNLLSLPDISFAQVAALCPALAAAPAVIQDYLTTEARYAGYLQRQQADIAAYRRDAAITLPADLDYTLIGGLSNEVILILNREKPVSLAAASRLQGVTPAALVTILKYLKAPSRYAA